MIGLCRVGPPVGSDRSDGDAVSWLERVDIATDLLDDPDDLVAEREIFPLTDRAVDRMHVGGTDEPFRRPEDRIGRSRFRLVFVCESGFADSVHDERFHGSSVVPQPRPCNGIAPPTEDLPAVSFPY